MHVTLIPIRAQIISQCPLSERHSLGVMEFVSQCRTYDVGVTDSLRVAVRGDLHRASRRHEVPQSPEEEVHEILMTPPHKWVAIEEAPHRASMWEIVIHGSELLLHVQEALVDANSCAIHVVQHLCTKILEQLDRVFDLLVPFFQGVQLFKRSGNDLSNIPKSFSMLCKLQRERQIRIPDHECITCGVKELQSVEPADSGWARLVWCRARHKFVWVRPRVFGHLDQIIDVAFTFHVVVHDITQIFVHKLAQFPFFWLTET
mmetsp:Transcript_42544/g.74728  ORF Transcript_42544/g.74728 Transcript_42544/m.74728 type:complete len:260 (+) Transcript_42544:348-1127(+)